MDRPSHPSTPGVSLTPKPSALLLALPGGSSASWSSTSKATQPMPRSYRSSNGASPGTHHVPQPRTPLPDKPASRLATTPPHPVSPASPNFAPGTTLTSYPSRPSPTEVACHPSPQIAAAQSLRTTKYVTIPRCPTCCRQEPTPAGAPPSLTPHPSARWSHPPQEGRGQRAEGRGQRRGGGGRVLRALGAQGAAET